MNRAVLLAVAGCLLLPATVCVFAGQVPAVKAAPCLHFSIPEQGLSTALIAFGKQAGIQVLTASDTVDKLRSVSVRGALTADAALDQLLQGSGLGHVFVDAGTVVVKAATPAPLQSAEAATAWSASTAHAKPLARVTVTGLIVPDNGYMVDASRSATRTDAELLDVPQSVGVVTNALLDSQQSLTVADAVRNVAGVQYGEGADALPVFWVRGFQVGSGMTDGLPNSLAAYGDFPPLIGIERVEVLKGPQAILGDASITNNFGGLLNIVLKKPQSEPVRRLVYSLGAYGDTRLGIDLAGALGGSKRWTGRLVLYGEYADRTAQGYRGQRGSYIAPSLGWRSATSQFVVGLESSIRRKPIPDHTAMLGDGTGSTTPAGLLLGHPDDHSLFRTSRLSYTFEHRFGPTWSFRSRGQYVRQSANVDDWILDNFSPTGAADAMAESYHYSDTFYTVQNDVVADFGQGWIRHLVVAGIDYERTLVGHTDDFLAMSASPFHDVFSGPALPPARTVAMSGDNNYFPGEPWTTHRALFLQDQVALGARWNVFVALRHATYTLPTEDVDGNAHVWHMSQWVPNLGLVYKVTPTISLYASSNTGFQPDTLVGKNGQPLLPSRSRQIETGAKFVMFQERARLTVSSYRIMLDHSTDLYAPKPPYFGIPGPGQTNRGLEVEFNGNVLPGLNVSASYALARVQNHDGSVQTGAARQRGNLWLSYRVQDGAWRGWGMAAGVLARSATLGQRTDGVTCFSIPGQARVDANVSWHASRWSVTLGVHNLFN